MPSPNLFEKRWVRWGLVFAVATFLGLFQASQGVFYWTLEGREVPWMTNLVRGVADWYVWALWTPLVFWFARRLPLEQPHWASHVVIHSALAVLLSDLTILCMLPVFQWSSPPSPPSPPPRSSDDVLRWLFTAHLLFYLWVYWGIVGLSHAISYYRKYQERELRASQLEARLAQARLQVLKMQLHPHFLFNTLNAISALMHQDVEVADRMIARLGTLLRLSLENDGAQEVTLAQEIDFVQAYLEIEQARLGERLHVAMDVEPETLAARVPNLILQPLVENAIRHGIAPRTQGGRLTIRSRLIGNELVVEVADDGPGLPGEGPVQEGIGLSNTRRRLQQLYGAEQRLEFDSRAGCRVRLVLPFRESMGDEPAMDLKLMLDSVSLTLPIEPPVRS